jgi:(S)-sulfolactate dehydrogenase
MTDIIITEFMDDNAVESLRATHDVRYDPTLVDDRTTLAALLGQATGLIVRNRTVVDEALLAAAPQLRVVGRLGVGLDNIDVPACDARSIAVIPATGANAVSVAEYVVASLLVLRRGQMFHATKRLLAGGWPRQELVGHEVAGTRLGLVGMGGIARLVADRAQALGVDVVAYDPFLPEDDSVWQQVTRSAELDELLAASDAVSLHVPLTPDTHQLLDAPSLALLPRGALVINTSRGGIVDEDALCAALTEGRLGGAALDVFEQEPLDDLSLARFADVPNLILTPHVAGVTMESNVAVSAMVADRVREVLDATGTPPNQVPGAGS